ncbi:phosphatase PAP2 family protein [[Actinomadura] parvosata]|uniref:phosphatase PAP2 family protein n=1 Tax=[Actinomadura] parvosata TaxID=1955412 RepID=UPI001644398E|nr:phosphatase PAP2 family protein [Nonomuraea sp. ATCC 55076]
MRQLRPVELLVLSYFGISAVLHVTLGDPARDGPMAVVTCVLPAALLLALIRLELRFRGRFRLSALRFAYPLLMLTPMYSSAARTVLYLHGHYVDEAVNAWEKSAFGVFPNVAMGAVHSPLLTEIVTICYFSYYGSFLIPFFLYARGRKPLAERYMFAALLVLLTCYLSFMFVPLAGPAAALPREFLAGRPDGYLVTDLQNAIMAAFDPPGTCFPSPHVAGAWITLLTLRRHVPELVRYALWAATAGLTVAVVYDWYHYASDALAGFLVALAVHAVTRRGTAFRPPPERPVPDRPAPLTVAAHP